MGYYWHLVGRDQRYSQKSYKAQDSPLTKIYLVQNVSSVKIEKPYTRDRLFTRALVCEKSLRHESCPLAAYNIVGVKKLLFLNL